MIDDNHFGGDNEAMKKVSAATCFLRVMSSDGRQEVFKVMVRHGGIAVLHLWWEVETVIPADPGG